MMFAGLTWMRGIDLIAFLVCGMMGLDYGGWQAKAIASSRSLNDLLERGEYEGARKKFVPDDTRFLEWPLKPNESPATIFSGSTTLPLASWGKVEVRMVLCQSSHKYAETLLWDLSSTEPRLIKMQVNPL